MTQDYYRILGVSYDAPKEEIRQAYLKLARKYHPDVNKEREAEEFLKSINEAYNALTNDEARALYDQDLDIPPPWMRSSVRAALVLVCLGASGALTWYGFSLQKPDIVAASSKQDTEVPGSDPVAAFNAQTAQSNGKNLEPTALPPKIKAPIAKASQTSSPVAKKGPLPKPNATALSKASAAKTAVPPKTNASKQDTVSMASVKIASVSKSWNDPWRSKKIAFADSRKKVEPVVKKPVAEPSKLIQASSKTVDKRELPKTDMSEADRKKLMANLPVKSLSYRASPNEILSTISIPMDDGTTVPANTLLKMDARIWNWKSGAFRKKLSRFINALIVSRDVDLAAEESGLSLNDVRYFAKQVNVKQSEG